MEQIEASEAYEYSPLPHVHDRKLSFRIFTLHPADQFSAPIRGDLRTYSILFPDPEKCVCEPYEALSYAWGDVTPTSTITFPDNSILPIAANLNAFLRHRRHHEDTLDLWIDAICINQADNNERSSQVQIMGQIYFLTSRLSIWLGPPSSDSALAMRTLRELSWELPSPN